jgi:hypothetical protein
LSIIRDFRGQPVLTPTQPWHNARKGKTHKKKAEFLIHLPYNSASRLQVSGRIITTGVFLGAVVEFTLLGVYNVNSGLFVAANVPPFVMERRAKVDERRPLTVVDAGLIP